MKYTFFTTILLCSFISCKKDRQPVPAEPLNTHLEYFGFSIVDTYWDDPTDDESKTNYADEVFSFCNVADILVLDGSEDITQRILDMHRYDMQALLHFNELFFELVDTNSASGANYDLRTDYENRWTRFKDNHLTVLTPEYIAAFYVGEEPTWNGISFFELNEVTNLLKRDFPEIPIMIIEAYPALRDLQIPEKADWIGFDRYFIKDPNINTEFQEDLSILKSRRSNSSQRIFLIMDSHYIDWAHGGFGGIDLLEMGEVANNYHRLAQNDDNIIGLIGYFWPNGFDTPGSIGARGMPSTVKDVFRKIGKEITGK